MASSTYEEVLHDAQQLTPEEQRRLREELAAMDARKARAQELMAELDELAARIGAEWQGGGTATDAVREQRREL